MPVIEILGIPIKRSALDPEVIGWDMDLAGLEREIQLAVAAIAELEIGSDQISVYFIRDTAQKFGSNSKTVVVKIEGVYGRPKRTKKVLRELENAVAIRVAEFIRKAKLGPLHIEAFIASMIEEDVCVHINVE